MGNFGLGYSYSQDDYEPSAHVVIDTEEPLTFDTLEAAEEHARVLLLDMPALDWKALGFPDVLAIYRVERHENGTAKDPCDWTIAKGLRVPYVTFRSVLGRLHVNQERARHGRRAGYVCQTADTYTISTWETPIADWEQATELPL